MSIDVYTDDVNRVIMTIDVYTDDVNRVIMTIDVYTLMMSTELS